MLNAAGVARFRELESSHAPSVVTDHLRQLIDTGSDFDCYKVNAFRLAAQLGCARREAVRALLFATRIGLFNLNWDIHCPSCRGVPDYTRHLMKLDHVGHCALCEIDWALDFEEQVEVTFTVNPDVRAVRPVEQRDLAFPDALAPLAQLLAREGRVPSVADCLHPGETKMYPVHLSPGDYLYHVPGRLDGGGRLRVEGAPATASRAVTIAVAGDGACAPQSITVEPGPLTLVVDYRYFQFWGFSLVEVRPPAHWVSAAYITSQQDFRDLFSGEFLAPDTSFALRSTTLMFTDIRGSTELYETLGDAAAYKLVQDHFRLMTEIIRVHEGGIVKTIGDAVMASFPRNVDAVRAACRIQRDFATRASDLRNIEVKIGLHRGPAIAVTSNRALDFFGRTVNVAARVQGRSKPREILCSPPVLADPEVRSFLDENRLALDSFDAQLKGVSESIRLSSIRL